MDSTAPVSREVSAHRKDVPPKPVVIVDPADLAPAVEAIITRIKAVHRMHRSTSLLFIDDRCRAYVVSDIQSIAQVWIRERLPWLVANYALVVPDGRIRKAVFPVDADEMAGDIAEHLADLGIALDSMRPRITLPA